MDYSCTMDLETNISSNDEPPVLPKLRFTKIAPAPASSPAPTSAPASSAPTVEGAAILPEYWACCECARTNPLPSPATATLHLPAPSRSLPAAALAATLAASPTYLAHTPPSFAPRSIPTKNFPPAPLPFSGTAIPAASSASPTTMMAMLQTQAPTNCTAPMCAGSSSTTDGGGERGCCGHVRCRECFDLDHEGFVVARCGGGAVDEDGFLVWEYYLRTGRGTWDLK